MERELNMTDTERRQLWFEARAALRLGGDYPDWPDKLALSVIAQLHDPANPSRLLGFLEAEAKAGRLPTETIELQRPAPSRRVARSSHLTSDPDRRPAPKPVESAATVVHRVRTASVSDVACVVGSMDIGRFLAAWIDPHRTPLRVPQVPNRRLKTAKKKKSDFVAEVVERIRAFHVERDKPFNSGAMPGDAGDLRWLMGRLYPEQFELMESKAFQDHYRGVCSWPRSAGQQKGARSLYIEIFPEAKASLAAVVPICK